MMATPIRAVDERVLPFAPEQIWLVLADVRASPRCWRVAQQHGPTGFDDYALFDQPK